jgi:two-component system KDP operon response regulator KdpE
VISVLVVDDEPDLRWMLRWALERRIGAQVLEAGTGAAALAAVAREPVDVIVLDLGLPDGDGWDVLGQLQRAAGASIPVIVASAFSDVGSRARADAAGCAGYLVKPFPPRELAALIQSIVAPGA